MWPPRQDDPAETYRRSDRRLVELLLGDGVYRAGFVRGDEARSEVARELARMREAFRTVVERTERARDAEARVVELEEELRRLAARRARRPRPERPA